MLKPYIHILQLTSNEMYKICRKYGCCVSPVALVCPCHGTKVFIIGTEESIFHKRAWLENVVRGATYPICLYLGFDDSQHNVLDESRPRLYFVQWKLPIVDNIQSVLCCACLRPVVWHAGLTLIFRHRHNMLHYTIPSPVESPWPRNHGCKMA